MRVAYVTASPDAADTLCDSLREAGCSVVTHGANDISLHPELLDSSNIMVLDVPEARCGQELCAELRGRGAELPILMLTDSPHAPDRIAGVAAGADICESKPVPVGEALARVRALARRAAVPGVRRLCYGDVTLDLFSRKLTHGSHSIELSRSEFLIVEHLLRNHHRPVTRGEIADVALHGHSSSNLVDVHIYSMRKRLREHGFPPMIATFRGVGYRLAPLRERWSA